MAIIEDRRPRVSRIVLSRNRVRWIVTVGHYLVGFKKQTQFNSFATACFIASCIAKR